MLLNELQEQTRENKHQAAELTRRPQQVVALTRMLETQRTALQAQQAEFEKRLSAVEQTLAAAKGKAPTTLVAAYNKQERAQLCGEFREKRERSPL